MKPHLFTDGGCIKKNPSVIGGMWAWVLVEQGIVVASASGVITPEEMGTPTVTNNQTELYAAVRGLDAMGTPWDGVLHTDSQVTLFRLSQSNSWNGIPPWLGQKARQLRKKRLWDIVLVAGHPTKREISEGRRQRNGLMTSPFNVMCDEMCRQAAWNYLGQNGEKA